MVIDLTGVLEDGTPRSANVPVNPRRTLSFPLGTTLTINLRVVRPSGAVVTGGTVAFTVKKKFSDSQSAISKSATLADPTPITVAAADTKLLTPGAFSYDFWHTDGSGNRNAVVPLSPLYIEAAAKLPP